ncbi:hypothetical protein [Anaeroselena agilis]|uniref:Uncharacterized protein n=1 Tax=Anaeroselena agilis TaxID=3063788 RepID=A0ABU3NWC0_9FIRM|nr:hypothetical protein [Selenomonadales bacterium 4137-cl]
MLSVDFAGLILTVCLTGLRYPLCVLGAAVIHDLGAVLTALVFQGRVDSVIAAGAFGTASVSGVKAGVPAVMVALGGSLVNYLVGASFAGAAWEKNSRLLNPGAVLKQPFAVINLRLAVLSAIVALWQFI